MNKLSELITDELIASGHVDSAHREAYIYCYDYVIEQVKFNAILLLIGILIHKFIITVLFLTVFELLRKYSGGYHASSPLLCSILSYATYILLLGSIVLLNHIPIIITTVLFFLCIIIIFILTPVPCKTKKFSEQDIQRLRKKMYLILPVIIIFYIFFMYYKYTCYCYTLTFCVMIISVSLLVQNHINRREFV